MQTKEQADIAAKATRDEQDKVLAMNARKRARRRFMPGKWTLVLAGAGGLAGFAVGLFFLEETVRSSCLGIVLGSLWGRHYDGSQ